MQLIDCELQEIAHHGIKSDPPKPLLGPLTTSLNNWLSYSHTQNPSITPFTS